MGYPQLVLNTAPAAEPVSLAEAKLHLRLDVGAFSDQVTTAQSIVPGDHVVAASYSLVGTAVDVLGYSVLVNLNAGTCGSGGSIACKLQHSDDNVTYADVTSGAFTTVTESNDNAVQELAYTGGKRYLKAVATVAVATCDFSVDIVKGAVTSVEDDLITAHIVAARQYCEEFQNRAYITQTWELWLDEFPTEDFIKMPMAPLASVTSIEYYDTTNTKATQTATDYFVDTKSTPGRVALAYGKSWPSTTLRPTNGVCITFTCGYGATAALFKTTCHCAWKVIAAIKLLIGDLYENREAKSVQELKENPAVMALLWQDRVM